MRLLAPILPEGFLVRISLAVHCYSCCLTMLFLLLFSTIGPEKPDLLPLWATSESMAELTLPWWNEHVKLCCQLRLVLPGSKMSFLRTSMPAMMMTMRRSINGITVFSLWNMFWQPVAGPLHTKTWLQMHTDPIRSEHLFEASTAAGSAKLEAPEKCTWTCHDLSSWNLSFQGKLM